MYRCPVVNESRKRLRAPRKLLAGLGSVAFLLAAPGTVAGLGPWLLTGYRFEQPFTPWWPLRIIGAALIVCGLLVLIRAFAGFVPGRSRTPPSSGRCGNSPPIPER